MRKISKTVTLFLTLVIALSCLTMAIVKSVNAQSVAKPSVPEFTAKYVDRSYDIPPTYGTDQYTGKTVVTNQGEHIDNRTVEFTIKNQPFAPFTDDLGNSINMFYNIRFKGSFGKNWTEMFGVERMVWYSFGNPEDDYGYVVQDTSSQYTTVIYTLPWNIPSEGTMDIQVEALQGYTNRTIVIGHINMVQVAYTFYGQESGWSNMQTITLGAASTSTSNPTPAELPSTSPPNAESPTNSTPNWTYNPTEAKPAEGNQLQTFGSVPLTTFLFVVAFFVAVVVVLSILVFRRQKTTA
jgi:hypothetical protein